MEIVFKNVMETLVLQKLEAMLDKLDCCKCEKCRLDIAAYALNHLPPKYAVSRVGEVLSKLNVLSVQHEADIISLLVMGADIVKNNPRHNTTEK
ncbi:late competence development ComFB family protein [Oscillospiraceae bacterium PP1C4]